MKENAERKIPQNFFRGISKLFTFKVDRTINECCCLKFMFMVIFFLGKILNEVHMFSVADFDSTGSLSAELMEMSVRKVGVKFYFMEMVFSTGEIHSFSGHSAESMIMADVTFIKDSGAAG